MTLYSPHEPGPCTGEAHHEHPCSLCGTITSGIGDSYCPECSNKRLVAIIEETERLRLTYKGSE